MILAAGIVYFVTIVVLMVTCYCACRKPRSSKREIGSASDMKNIEVGFTNQNAEENHVTSNPENNCVAPNKDDQHIETILTEGECELIACEPDPQDVKETTSQRKNSKKQRYMQLKRGSKAYFAHFYTKLLRNKDRKTDSLAVDIEYAEFRAGPPEDDHDNLDKNHRDSTGEDYADISSPRYHCSSMGSQDFEYVPDMRHLKKSQAEDDQDYFEILDTNEKKTGPLVRNILPPFPEMGKLDSSTNDLDFPAPPKEGHCVDRATPDASKDYIDILPQQGPVIQRDSVLEDDPGYLKILSTLPPLNQTNNTFLEDDSGYLKPESIVTELESTGNASDDYAQIRRSGAPTGSDTKVMVRVQEPKIPEKKIFVLPSTFINADSVDKRLMPNETDVYESYDDGHAMETDKPIQDTRPSLESPLARSLTPDSPPKNELKTSLSSSELYTSDTKGDLKRGDFDRKHPPKVSPRFPRKDLETKAQTLTGGLKVSPGYQQRKPRSTTVPDGTVQSAFLSSLEKVIKESRSLSDPTNRENGGETEQKNDLYEDISASPEDSPKKRKRLYSNDYEYMDENKNVVDHVYEYVEKGSSEDDLYEQL